VVVYQRVVTPDEKIRYTYISEGAQDIFGVSPAEILSDPEALFGRHSDEYKAKFRERLLAASKALTTWDVEASIVTRDGRKKYTHAIARPERQPDGSVLWTGIILDETRTREAVVEGLSQGFLLYGADDRLILRNSHFLDLYPSLKDIAVPGARFDEVVRAEVDCGVNDPMQNMQPPAVFRMRMERHREPRNIFEWQLSDSRWVLVNEARTRDGGTVVLYTDITELKRREREIQFLADHDTLTGLHNRASFQRRAEEALVGAKRRGTTVAIMCLDLDHFKNVNDTLGHAAGDEFLKCVAKRLRACFRDMDTVARFGGDEFGIVFTDLKQPETATTLVSRLLEIVSHPMDFNGQQIVSGVSIGVALSATDGDDADGLIKRADLALYRAKAEGRGTFRPPAGRDQEPTGAALSAPDRYLHRRARRIRIAGALAPSGTWNDLALGLHPAGRGNRDHRQHRRMGPAPGMQRRAGVAELDQGGRQRIAGAVQDPQYRPACRQGPRGHGAQAEQARARNHRVDIVA
jgi:diguanylate cyclase (GGDEF)-like protein